MRRLIATTLLSLGLTGGAAMASPWRGGADVRHPVAYHDGAARGFERGFDRGREVRGREARAGRFERPGMHGGHGYRDGWRVRDQGRRWGRK